MVIVRTITIAYFIRVSVWLLLLHIMEDPQGKIPRSYTVLQETLARFLIWWIGNFTKIAKSKTRQYYFIHYCSMRKHSWLLNYKFTDAHWMTDSPNLMLTKFPSSRYTPNSLVNHVHTLTLCSCLGSMCPSTVVINPPIGRVIVLGTVASGQAACSKASQGNVWWY